MNEIANLDKKRQENENTFWQVCKGEEKGGFPSQIEKKRQQCVLDVCFGCSCVSVSV